MTETFAQKNARLKAQREASSRPISADSWAAAQAQWQAEGNGLTALDRKVIGHLMPTGA